MTDFEASNLPRLTCETDKEVTSSDESFDGEKAPYYYTRFKIRDHVRAFFKASEGAIDDEKQDTETPENLIPNHLISCSATKMAFHNQNDSLIYNHLKCIKSLTSETDEPFPSQWRVWIQNDHEDCKEESVKVNSAESLREAIKCINEHHTRKKVHILRTEITPATKKAYSRSSVFMKVPPADEMRYYHRYARVILSNKISQPLSIKTPVVGISLSKAAKDYSLIILCLHTSSGAPDEMTVHEMLEALIQSVEGPYIDVIKTSVFVSHDPVETIEMYPKN